VVQAPASSLQAEASSRRVNERRGVGDAGEWRGVVDAGRCPRAAALGMQGRAWLTASIA
jgi:hypothetical protein